MEKVREFLNDFGIHISLMVAGALGALLSLEDKQGLSTYEKVFVFISGGVVSNYLTPAIVYWTDLNKNYMFGLAFLLGFSGLKGVKAIILYIKKRFFNKK